jgi:hypothetical protein
MLKGEPSDWVHVPSEAPVELANYSPLDDYCYKLKYGRFPDMIRPAGESAAEFSQRRRKFTRRKDNAMLEQQPTLDLPRPPPARTPTAKIEALRRVLRERTTLVDAAARARETKAWRHENGKMLAVRGARNKVREMVLSRPEDFGYEVIETGNRIAYVWRR